MAGYAPLPAYQTPNALNFQPLSQGIDDLASGIKQGRTNALNRDIGQAAAAGDWKGAQNAAFNGGQIDQGMGIAKYKQQSDAAALDHERKVAQQTAGIAQMIMQAPPEQGRAMWQKMNEAHPEMGSHLAKYGIDPSDHIGAAKFMIAEARGYVNPNEEAMQREQLNYLRNQNAMAPLQRQQAELTIAQGKNTAGVIGVDGFGQPIHGFIDPINKTATPFKIQGGLHGSQGAGDAGLQGDDYLKSLDPRMASMVKATADGLRPYPTGMAAKIPENQAIIRHLSMYEPNADANLFKVRGATQVDMAKGRMGQNVASFNTALGHMHDLYKQIDGLDNSSVPILNAPMNAVRTRASDTTQAKFDTFDATASKVIAETEKAFKGTGATVDDMKHAREELNSNKSPAALKATVRKYLDLMESRIEALGDQYNRGMQLAQPRAALSLLSPKSQKIVEELKADGGKTAGVAPMISSAQPVKVATPDDARKLPSGTPIQLPDGTIGRVP